MASFIELPIHGGVGPVHMNRFRTIIEPRAGMVMPNGYELVNNMHRFMDARTAKVEIDEGHRWNNEASLLFTGVARVRPFAVLPTLTVPPGLIPVPDGFGIPVPAQVRDWLMPDIHTDSVGHTGTPKPHAFTVQTLKRLYATKEDAMIEQVIETAVVTLLSASLSSSVVTIPLIPLLAIQSVRKAVAGPLVAYALEVNRHHFLAGRRSFRMGTAADFGLSGNHWVFETAALEAYSHPVFQHTTDIVMGGAASTVTPVWMQMGAKVAAAYGRQVGTTAPILLEKASLADAMADPLYRSIAAVHADLVP